MYVFFYVIIHITVSLRELKILKIPLFLDKGLVDGVDKMVYRRRVADHRYDGYKQNDPD